MKNFASLFEKIDQTQSTNEKVQYLKEYFSQATPGDAAWALFFLSGYRLKRLISGRKMLGWMMRLTDYPAWLLEEAYASVGDTAELITLLLPASQKKPTSLDHSLSDWVEQFILPLYQKTDEEQFQEIAHMWTDLPKNETFILNKLLTGSFRVGVSHLLTNRAVAEVLNVPTEIISHKVMGDWKPTSEFYLSLSDTLNQEKLLTPYPFYLASPLEGTLEDLGSPDEWLAEWKWDGIRAQGIRRTDASALWSRGNELISHQFPEITEALLSLPNDTVVDGEILAYLNERPLSFGDLQKRLGRKKVSKSMLTQVPITFMLYDVLEYKGEDYRQLPLKERRKIVEELASLHPRIIVSPAISYTEWETIYQKRLEAKTYDTEGLMLKRWSSAYGVGRRRGNWYKYKVDPMTIDAILLYAQAGKGRRANTYTDYTFGVWHEGELIPIAKAYSGLNQEEINELDRWIRKHTMEKFGPVRKVEAFQVFELAFEGIQISNRHKSGVALRFPRILRWRKDKPAKEADVLEIIKKTFLK